MEYKVVKPQAIPSKRRSYRKIDWEKVKEIAARNPGQYVQVGPVNPSVATHIRNGRYQSFPEPEKYEVVVRKYVPEDPDEVVEGDKVWLFVRVNR